MRRFKKGDWVTWTRPSNGARERGRVIDTGLDSSTVCIEIEGDRSYWVLTTHVEHASPPGGLAPGSAQYTSPTLTHQQVQALMTQLEVADRKGLSVCLRITEHAGGPTTVELVPNEPVF